MIVPDSLGSGERQSVSIATPPIPVAERGQSMYKGLPIRSMLRSSLVQVFASNMLRAIFGLLVTMAAARLLGPEAFGNFSTFVALAVLAYCLFGEGFEPGVVRQYARALPLGLNATAGVVGSALAMRGLLLVPLVLVFWAVVKYGLSGSMVGFAISAVVAGLAASLAMLGLSAFQAQGQFGRYAILSPAANAIRLLLIPLLWWSGTLTLHTLVGSYVLAYCAAALASLLLMRPVLLVVHVDLAVLREMLRFGSWSALATSCFVLMAYLQVPLVVREVGPSSAGMYAAAATLLMFIDQLTAALLTTKMAFTSRIETVQGLRSYVRAIAPRLLLLAALLCFLFPLAPFIIALLFGDKFVPAATVMQVLLPGFLATLLSHPLYLVLYSVDKPQLYAASGVLSLLGFLMLVAWLLPTHGLVGMAWASSLARGLQAVLIVAMVFHAISRVRDAPACEAVPPNSDLPT